MEELQKGSIHHDEPTVDDQLNRLPYARALASIVNICKTPLVIGVYGGWGSGKTSLMKLIEAELEKMEIPTIWFDAWQHQHDDTPAVALLHTVVDRFGLGEEGRKLLTMIATAFSVPLLKATTSLEIETLLHLGERYEQERFLIREARVRLQAHFRKILQKVQTRKNERLVFFIDDLDRCPPKYMLNMLESLKLFLNVSGCVYFLSVDRQTLEKGIEHEFEIDVEETSYLDKIVQLPFSLPPISPPSMETFVNALLPEELKNCHELLVVGLGGNARDIKRFVNLLTLNHHLASSFEILNYDSRVLALILLIQHRNPGLFSKITRNPKLLLDLKDQNDSVQELYKELLVHDQNLLQIIRSTHIPSYSSLGSYVYLSDAVSESSQIVAKAKIHNLSKRLADHLMWLEGRGKTGTRLVVNSGDLHNVFLGNEILRDVEFICSDLSKADLHHTDLRRANLKGSNFEQANLYGANLREADLTEARLCSADLRRTDLRGSHLTGANLRGANLQAAIGISEDQLNTALLNTSTKVTLRQKK